MYIVLVILQVSVQVYMLIYVTLQHSLRWNHWSFKIAFSHYRLLLMIVCIKCKQKSNRAVEDSAPARFSHSHATKHAGSYATVTPAWQLTLSFHSAIPTSHLGAHHGNYDRSSTNPEVHKIYRNC